MWGKVKWFSPDRGYGFIYGEDDIERYVGVRDVNGADLPSNGDLVEFAHMDGKKGPRATNVDIVERQPDRSGNARRDDRVECPHCHKRMVPRQITYRGKVERSVCPFCSNTYQKFTACFVATAIYGDYDSEPVKVLRRFRDAVLARHWSGRLFISAYYSYGPWVAAYLTRHSKPRRLVKAILDYLVRVLR